MTVYKYVGRTKTGAHSKGTINAANRNVAIAKLREKGINPRELEESTSIFYKEIALGSPVKNEDIVIYCRQFATLIRAGVSIVDSTNILARQTKNKAFQTTLEQIEEDIRSGVRFSVATAKHPKVFPAIFTNMMRSGEATGNIDDTLERLANTLEKQYNLKKKIQSTMTYPMVLLAITILVVFFLLIFIVPSFVNTFEQMNAELPMMTVMTLALSKWLQNFWYIVILLFVLGVVSFQLLYKKNKKFHYIVHFALLKMPVFGPILQKSVIARLMRTMASLYSSAVPILNSLSISESVIGNPVVGKVVLEARESLEKGSTLTAPLEKSWLFPPLVTSMTSIGESTGSLDFMLEKIADFYETEVDRSVDTLKSLIEPLMILFLAIVVGFIVAAIMMPMFSLYQQI